MRLSLALLISAGLLFTFKTFVFAGPAMGRLTVNHETKQCGVYFPGDEHITYEPPSGWVDYGGVTYAEGEDYIETETKVCQGGDYDSGTIFTKCCEQLGYTYVEDPYNSEDAAQQQNSPNFFTRIAEFFRSIFN